MRFASRSERRSRKRPAKWAGRSPQSTEREALAVGSQPGIEALALNPDGVISFTSADAVQGPIQQANAKGIPVVGVLSAAKPGPDPSLGLFTNVSQDPAEIGKAEAQYAIAKENGAARVVILYDKLYAIARNKAEAMKAEIVKCANCKLLDFVSTPAAQISAERGPTCFELGHEIRARADMDCHGRRRLRRLSRDSLRSGGIRSVESEDHRRRRE